MHDVEWNVYCPRMIPTATIAGIASTICLNIGLWPVYGLFTPLILGTVSLGSLMALSFIPECSYFSMCRKPDRKSSLRKKD